MMPIVRQLKRMLRRHAATTLAGVALLAAAGIYHVALVLPARAQLEAERAALDAARDLARQDGPGKAPKSSVNEQLLAFHAFFPRSNSAPRWLDTLYVVGRADGLSMPSGEYKVERGRDMALTRYHVTLPVAGSYAQIRQFIAHVLEEIPAASLDDLQLRSDPDKQGRVEARLRFSLYFGGA